MSLEIVSNEDALILMTQCRLDAGDQLHHFFRAGGGGPYSDPDLQTFVWSALANLFSPFAVSSCVGRLRVEGGNDTTIPVRHHKPYQPVYNAAQDHHRYGSVVGSIGRALAVLSDNKVNKLRWQKEHNVQHGTASGVLYPAGSSDFGVPGTDREFYDHVFKTRKYLYPSQLDEDGYLRRDNINATKATVIDTFDILRFIEAYLPTTTGPHWISEGPIWAYEKTITDMLVSGPSYLGVMTLHWTEYHDYYARSNPDEGHSRAKYYSTIQFYPDPSWRSVPSGFLSSLGDDGFFSYTGYKWVLDVTVGDVSNEGSVYPFTPFAPQAFDAQYSGSCVIAGITANADDPGTLFEDVANKLRTFDRTVVLSLDDIYGAAYVSAAQAIADYRTILESNYVESITELRDFLSLIPEVGPLEDFLRLLPQGRLLAGTLRLVDFAANTYLLYQFGLKPFQADILAFAETYDRIAQKLRDLLREDLDVRGKFSYTFNEGTPLSGYTMVVRSKVVITFPRESVSAALLPLEANGLLPTPGNLWDLIPFSFVVDWFTNNDARWDLAENALHAMLAQTHYCVHSYTFHRDLGDDDAPPGGFYSPGSQHKYYVRVISDFFPSPGELKYDFLAPEHAPPELIGGALLWALIRGR